MGAESNSRSLLLYVNKGKLIQYMGQGVPPIQHDGWGGFLTNITFKYIDPKPEKNQAGYEALNIHIHDGTEPAIITCKFNSGYGRAFAKIIGQAQLDDKISIFPDYKEEGGQKFGGMLIKQNGEVLKWQWTKKDPGACPPPKEFEINGQKMVDYTDQMIFLKDYLLNVIKPQLESAPQASAHPLMTGTSDIQEAAKSIDTTPKILPTGANEEMDIADDLPF